MNNIDLNYVKNNYLDVSSFLSSPNYDDESIKNEISSIFIKDDWDSLFLSPDFFLDNETGCVGFDFMRAIEKENVSENIIFILTEFQDVWIEEYSSYSIASSEKDEWQTAFSGVCFFPDNEKWFALYVDRPYADFIMFASELNLIHRVNQSIDPKNILF